MLAGGKHRLLFELDFTRVLCEFTDVAATYGAAEVDTSQKSDAAFTGTSKGEY